MPLPPVPDHLVPTRAALHRVAAEVLAPLRVQETGGEIALTVRDEAVATPDLPRGGWAGVTGTELIVVSAAGATSRPPLTSLSEAGRHVGLRTADELDEEPLELDRDAALFLTGAVFPLAARVLAELRADATDPSPIRLWPEHFDIAYDDGAESAGARAGYGVSPGDEQHDEPYAYVGPWNPPPGDPALWTATGFPGAELSWRALAAEPDPAATLLEFWRTRRTVLATV